MRVFLKNLKKNFINNPNINSYILNKNISKIIILICLFLIFWVIRLNYWKNTSEAPFSDMLDYETIANNIVNKNSFSLDTFRTSYLPPTLPFLRAIILVTFGEKLLYWQLFQTSLLFLSLIWLSFEIYLLTKNKYISFLLILVVSLSKSSIFWSYKISHESLSEMFIYLVSALTFYSLRNKSKISYFILGLISIIASFNRLNFFPVIFLLIFIILFNFYKISYKKALLNVLLFIVGILIIWIPWIYRNYRLFNKILPLTTQGPYTFLWEVGKMEGQIDKFKYEFVNVSDLSKYVKNNFSNEYEGYVFSSKIMSNWIKLNYKKYPKIVLTRTINQLTNKTEYLTKVSREHLFNSNPNNLLLDKNLFIIILGFISCIFLLFNKIYPFILISISSWITTPLLLSYPRMLEPIIPTLIWAAVISIFSIFNLKIENIKHKQFYDFVLIAISLFICINIIIYSKFPLKSSFTSIFTSDNFEKNTINNTSISNWNVEHYIGTGELPNYFIGSTEINNNSKLKITILNGGTPSDTTSLNIHQKIDVLDQIKGENLYLSFEVSSNKPSKLGVDIVDGINHYIYVIETNETNKIMQLPATKINSSAKYIEIIFWPIFNKYFGFNENFIPNNTEYLLDNIKLSYNKYK